MKWKLCAIALCICTLTACENANEVNGKLNTFRAFDFVSKEGKKISLDPYHVYNSALKMAENGSELAISTGLFQEAGLLLTNPAKNQIGEIHVGASEIKQDFSVSGTIQIVAGDVDSSRLEPCTYGHEQIYVCQENAPYPPPRPVPTPGSPNPPPHTAHCHWEDHSRHGTKWVHEISHVNDKVISLSFEDFHTQEILATYSGTYRLSSQILEYSETNCSN